MSLAPIEGLDGSMRAMAIQIQQPPAFLRFLLRFPIRKIHQPVDSRLIVGPSIGRGREEGQVVFLLNPFQANVLDGV